MNFEDLIGYFVSFLAVIYFLSSFFKNKKAPENKPRRQMEHSESKKKLKKLLRPADFEDEDEEFSVPQAPPYSNKKKKIATHALSNGISKQYQHTQFDKSIISKPAPEQAVAFIQQARPSRGRNIVTGLKSTQDLIIIREILGPPKSVGAIHSHEFWG